MKLLLTTAFLASTIVMPGAKADIPPAKICVVAQATLDQSAVYKSILSQLEKKRAEIQKELASDEKKLKDEDKTLVESQKTLPEKEFNTKRQAFEKKVHDIQVKLEIRRVQMEVAFEDAKKKVFDTFLKVADEVKKEVGANIMLYKETIVTADSSFDVSSKVLEKLDKALPTVQVTFKSEAEIKQMVQNQQKQ